MSFVKVERGAELPTVTSHRMDDQTGGGTAVRIPNIRIHAFCETPALLAEIKSSVADRRMSRTTLSEHAGGVAAAIKAYRNSSTPELIILESRAEGDAVLAEVDALAGVCDPGTKLILVGRSNDIDLFRGLMQRGVSEYLRMPLDAPSVISAIAGLYSEPSAAKLGRVYAFVGARGGVGSSTIAHNVAWTIGRYSDSDVILADLDLPFGTAALDFNLAPERGIEDAVRETDRLDDQLLEGLLTPCGEHLSLLAAPALLISKTDLDTQAVEKIIDLARSSAAHVALDVPHIWSEWTRQALFAADEIVITASPDLASLRNTRNLLDLLRQIRPRDGEPTLVLNQVGTPKRPEIKPAKFAESVGVSPLVTVPFDPRCFGAASNTGRMLPEGPSGRQYAAILHTISEAVIGRRLPRRRPGALRRLFGSRKSAR